MSKAKFKTGDLVENKYTKEVEMIKEVEIKMFGNQLLYFVSNDWMQFVGIMEEHYTLLSPQSVKFNLK
jgi:hypothetical protein